jgi:SHS2 domain-containing protein
MTAESVKGYEFFEHTADIGIRASGTTLEELFVHMARGLVELIAEDSVIQPQDLRMIQLEASAADELLFAWLRELLFLFSTERFLPSRYAFDAATPTMLRGRVLGSTFDPSRHVQGREVKAITRHRLSVSQQDGLWRAEVIVDI